jgi:hypothetical protein
MAKRKKKTYEVEVTVTITVSSRLEVEAESAEEAEKLAEARVPDFDLSVPEDWDSEETVDVDVMDPEDE